MGKWRQKHCQISCSKKGNKRQPQHGRGSRATASSLAVNSRQPGLQETCLQQVCYKQLLGSTGELKVGQQGPGHSHASVNSPSCSVLVVMLDCAWKATHQRAKAAHALYGSIQQHPKQCLRHCYNKLFGVCILRFCAKASLARMLQISCIAKSKS